MSRNLREAMDKPPQDTLTLLRSGQFSGCKRLDLSCGLQQFPEEIYALADSLEILNLSGNALSSLPDDLTRLHRLRVIFCSDNQFTHVPEVLGECENLEMVGFKANRISRLSAEALPQQLRWLILTDNLLEEVPAELGQRPRLQKLMLAGNRLRRLPDEMAGCHKLELLRISANRFEVLPEWLVNLPRLAWLAFGGNPCSDEVEAVALAKHPVVQVKWDTLTLQHKLGEGASGIIHQALWQHTEEGEKQVAVKLFKGNVTSDGLPHSEKAACIVAGTHPNLIPVAGKISGHPEGIRGLVMSLVDAEFSNLAGPPSLESCTRDIYPDKTRFSLAVAISMALGIAAVAKHLHARGIMHGDLYAHNMLWNGRGDCRLGDFGAASFLPFNDELLLHAFERIEVSAFGCFLEELLERVEGAADIHGMIAPLCELQKRCIQAETAQRPSFSEIQEVLQQLRVDEK